MDVGNILGVMEIVIKVDFGWGKGKAKEYYIIVKELDMRGFGKMIVRKGRVLYLKEKEREKYRTEKLGIIYIDLKLIDFSLLFY